MSAGTADEDEPRDPAPGLCGRCAHALCRPGARSTFWECGRHRGDASFRRYPELPVRECRGFEESDPTPPGRRRES